MFSLFGEDADNVKDYLKSHLGRKAHIFYIYGRGGNGKTTFVKLLEQVHPDIVLIQEEKYCKYHLAYANDFRNTISVLREQFGSPFIYSEVCKGKRYVFIEQRVNNSVLSAIHFPNTFTDTQVDVNAGELYNYIFS
jgi:ABC-type molybdenum transport system ATPase subunit/photorepair protein PhrA